MDRNIVFVDYFGFFYFVLFNWFFIWFDFICCCFEYDDYLCYLFGSDCFLFVCCLYECFDYRVFEIISVGVYGIIYCVIDMRRNEVVVIKVIKEYYGLEMGDVYMCWELWKRSFVVWEVVMLDVRII